MPSRSVLPCTTNLEFQCKNYSDQKVLACSEPEVQFHMVGSGFLIPKGRFLKPNVLVLENQSKNWTAQLCKGSDSHLSETFMRLIESIQSNLSNNLIVNLFFLNIPNHMFVLRSIWQQLKVPNVHFTNGLSVPDYHSVHWIFTRTRQFWRL